MARTLTYRGLRGLSPAVGLPRETQAAAKTIETVAGATDRLVAAKTPIEVREILSESFASAMLDMSIRRDPHVSLWGHAMYVLTGGATTTIQEVDFFDPARAAGAGGSGVASIANNLITPHKPLKPFVLRSIGMYVSVESTIDNVVPALMHLQLRLLRGKESIFELPLIAALCGFVWRDRAAQSPYAAPVVDLEPVAGGGIEIEGHGAPYGIADDISLRLSPIAAGTLAASPGMITYVVRVDGEAVEV